MNIWADKEFSKYDKQKTPGVYLGVFYIIRYFIPAIGDLISNLLPYPISYP